jgi:hypothetical protein
MIGLTHRGHEDDTGWHTLPALDQWLWILRSKYAGRGQQAGGFTEPIGASGQPLIRLLERHAARYGDEVPSVLPTIVDVAGFLKGTYKAVFRSAPLDSWESLLLTVPREILPFTRHETRVLSTLSRYWRLLLEDDRRIRLEAAEDFIPFLVEAVGGHIVEKNYIANELVYTVRLDAVTLAVRDVPLFVSFVFSHAGSVDKAKRWTEELWHRLLTSHAGGQHLAITVAVGTGTEYAEYTNWAHTVDWLVCLSADELKDIFTAERYAHKLQAILRNNLGLSKLNPYKWEGPVRPDMCFGRDREIQKILTQPFRDFLVIGSRQIGKSSLLTYLEDTVASSGRRKVVFLDCSDITSPDNFAEKIAAMLAPQRAHRMTLGRFGQMMRAARSRSEDPFLLLLDEADQLVGMAAGTDWRLLNILRDLSNRGVCQTILAGYKALFSAWQDRQTPLFNFASPMHLSVLPHASARQLVETPLSQLSVQFNPSELVSQILDETGSHPSLLQFFCSSLISILDERSTKIVTSAELKAVRESREYREMVLKPFATLKDFTLVERWLVLTLVREKRFIFNSQMILTQFGSTRPWLHAAEIAAAFAGLELSGLIRQHSQQTEAVGADAELGYKWTVPAFVVVTEKSTHVERDLQDIERKLAS